MDARRGRATRPITRPMGVRSWAGAGGLTAYVRACVCVGVRACVVAVLRVIKRRIEWSVDNERERRSQLATPTSGGAVVRLSPARLAKAWMPPSRPAQQTESVTHVRTHAHPRARTLHKAASSFKPPIPWPGDAAHLVTVSRNEDT